MRYAIYGAGGFGREIAPLAEESASLRESVLPYETDGRRSTVVFVDDKEFPSGVVNGFSVIGFNELIGDEHRDRHVIAAIGDGRAREKLENLCRPHGLTIGRLFARSFRNLNSNEIGDGAAICDFVTIGANAKIGKSFQANLYCYVAHDCIIGDYVTFGPRVTCNGNVHIGDYAYVGAGVVIKQGTPNMPLVIGEGAIVGMGTVVTKSIEPYAVVVGNPARMVRMLDRPPGRR